MTVPPRSEAKPMAPGLRAPVMPSRPRSECSRKVEAAPLGRRFAEQQRGARRRVDLHAMVHFDDLDVELLAQRARRVAHQRARAD